MAKHNVYLDLPRREINKADAHFEIFKNYEKLSQLTISKGGLDYYPTNSKKPIKITWTQFDKMIKDWEEK